MVFNFGRVFHGAEIYGFRCGNAADFGIGDAEALFKRIFVIRKLRRFNRDIRQNFVGNIVFFVVFITNRNGGQLFIGFKYLCGHSFLLFFQKFNNVTGDAVLKRHTENPVAGC